MEMIQVAKSQGLAPLETVEIIIDHGLDMMSSDAFLEFGMMNI